jgi:asparagine synthase (glutamine-hydrolysing)
MPYGLELADKLAAARGLEPRYPFFDRRLVEYCVALPLNQKFGQGWDRYIFRRAMEGLVPREVQWRVIKADLSHSFKRRLLEVDRPRIEALLATAEPVLAPYVDLPTLRSVYRRYIEHPGESNGEALEVYSVANLALWLQAARLAV